MCGFSIIINLDGQNKRSNIHSIIDMNNLLKHRGPDDEGYLIIDNEFSYELFKRNDSKEKKTTQYFFIINILKAKEIAILKLLWATEDYQF